MGAYTLERSVRYLSVKTRRAWRSFKREYRPTLRTATRLARNGVIFAATAAGLGAAYDYVSHANDFVWGAVARGNCVDVGFVAAHVVQQKEDVTLRVRPFVGNDIQPGVVFDFSGNPISAGGHEFCFDTTEIADAGVVFQAENGFIQGTEEVYNYESP